MREVNVVILSARKRAKDLARATKLFASAREILRRTDVRLRMTTCVVSWQCNREREPGKDAA